MSRDILMLCFINIRILIQNLASTYTLLIQYINELDMGMTLQ